MATVLRFVNTASSGGDGTTDNTAGGTAAYASLTSWEANTGASNTATDDYIVDCSGVAADTVGVSLDFGTNITTGSITIRGNRSNAAGFYNGNAVISTNHYRLDVGDVATCLSIAETNITIDGIQIIPGATTNNRAAIISNATTYTVKQCRLLNGGSVDFGVGSSTSHTGSHIRRIENCLIVGFDVAGIKIVLTNNHSPTYNLYHNTIYGDGVCDGIEISTGGTGGTPTFNIKANAIAGSGSGVDIDTSGVLATGVVYNFDDNALDQYNLGTNGEIDLGTLANAWTSHGTSISSDFTVKNASSPLYASAAGTLVSTDIRDVARSGAAYDVGCFELIVAAFEAHRMILTHHA